MNSSESRSQVSEVAAESSHAVQAAQSPGGPALWARSIEKLEQHRAAHRTAQEALISCVVNVIESGQRLQRLTDDLVTEFRRQHQADKRRAKRQRRQARQQPGGTAQ